jgi:hypothetical protein
MQFCQEERKHIFLSADYVLIHLFHPYCTDLYLHNVYRTEYTIYSEKNVRVV